MPKPLFDFCLITRNEERTLPRLLSSLEEFKAKGGIVNICDTGSTDKTVEIAKAWGCNVKEVGEKFQHTISEEEAKAINEKFIVEGELPVVKGGDKYFDFSSARNEAAEMASQDWVSFADADEVMTKLDIEAINKDIEANPNLANFEYEFIFAHRPDGKPAVQFIQSKFYSKAKLRWSGLVHECLSPIDNGGELQYLTPDIFLLEHWQEPGDRHSYLKGLVVDCFNNPLNDRNSHYAAREMMWSNRPKSALKEFQRHLTLGGWLAERAESLIFCGDIYGKI